MTVLPRWQAAVTDLAGNAQVNPIVDVINELTGLRPSLFSDQAATSPLGNPFTASSSDGTIGFYCESGNYAITATKGSLSKVWHNVDIGKGRIIFTADRGLQFGPGTPYPLPNDALSYAHKNFDLAGFKLNVTPSASAAYSGNIDIFGPFTGAKASDAVTLIGDNTTPSLYPLVTPNSNPALRLDGGAAMAINGFNLAASGHGGLLEATNNSLLIINGNMEYGNTFGCHIFAQLGANVTLIPGSHHKLVGNAQFMFQCNNGAYMQASGIQFIFVNGVGFVALFVAGGNSYISLNSNNYSNAGGIAAGAARDIVLLNSIINTGNNGAGMPGTPGTPALGGIFL